MTEPQTGIPPVPPVRPYAVNLVREAVRGFSLNASWQAALVLVRSRRLHLDDAAQAHGYIVAHEFHILGPDDPALVLPTIAEDDALEAVEAPLGRLSTDDAPPRKRLTRRGRIETGRMVKPIRGGFVKAMGSEIVTDKFLSDGARALAHDLRRMSGHCEGSIASFQTYEMAAFQAVHRSTIWRWVKELCARGYLWAHTNKVGRNRFGATSYLLLSPALNMA